MSDRGFTTISGEIVGNQVLEEFEATLHGKVIHSGCASGQPHLTLHLECR